MMIAAASAKAATSERFTTVRAYWHTVIDGITIANP